jgi:RNA polymerase sigma factor (sigma-70 family)
MSLHPDILRGCLENNRQCQKQLYDQYYDFLMGVCYRYAPNNGDARFLVNEGFFKILTKIDRYDKIIPFEVWIRRVMINTIIDAFRKNKKEKQLVVLQEEPALASHQQHADMNYAEAHIEAVHLQKMLQKVPDVSRKVFNLFAIDGYSHKEIAELLNITEGTSKWHVSNARQLLKAQLISYLKKTELRSYAK